VFIAASSQVRLVLSVCFSREVLQMYASVRVEGKLLEVIGGDEGAFPFRILKTSRRRRVFVKLTM